MPNKYKAISLFTGGMGLDLGLEKAGISAKVAVEIDLPSVQTIKSNRPGISVISDSIADVSGRGLLRKGGLRKGEVDVVAGGPPCQSFSVYGNREGAIDPRGQMVFEFVRMVRETMPLVFIMENVRGLHSMPFVPEKFSESVDEYSSWMSESGSLLRSLVSDFNEAGYRVDSFLVNSVNYGAPQIRERLLLVGNRFDVQAKFPAPQFSNRIEDALPPFATLRDAIGDDFIDPDPSMMNFSPRKLKYLAMVPPGGNWRSLPIEIQKESMGKSWYLKGGRSATWRRLSWDFPSPTVVTMPNHASTSMCHPDEVRALTVGECAAIQEFPAAWKLCGKTAERYKQIGNAVPVRLGSVVGRVAAKVLSEIRSRYAKTKRKVVPPTTDLEVVHLRPHVRTKQYFKDGVAFSGDSNYYAKPEYKQLSLLGDSAVDSSQE